MYHRVNLLRHPKYKLADNLDTSELARLRNQKIVLTTGSFDYPLHLEHLRYLKTAASFGDVLLIGVDSDENLRRRKGETRPIAPFDVRALTLCFFDCVTLVFKHPGNDHELIRLVRPDVFVQSESTTQESLDVKQSTFDLVESFGGEVKILPTSNEFDISTSKIIKKIQSNI